MAKKISVDWSRSRTKDDIEPALARYKRYLEKIGLKENTIKLYIRLAGVYLEAVQTEEPSKRDANDFYDSLHQKKLSRSSINNYAASIIKYHKLIEKPVKLPFLKLNNSLPYYFDEMDVLKIFDVCNNVKHYCMLKVLFFGCLRSGELCKLTDQDYNPQDLTLRLRETKNGSDNMAFINDETARVLNHYLKIRPPVKIDGQQFLFFTDYGHAWTSNQVYKMFLYYKQLAGIEKKGSVHCFSRHSTATLLVKAGCDLTTIQALLHHRDIHTTLKYTHLNNKVTREKYEKYLVL